MAENDKETEWGWTREGPSVVEAKAAGPFRLYSQCLSRKQIQDIPRNPLKQSRTAVRIAKDTFSEQISLGNAHNGDQSHAHKPSYDHDDRP